jgi:hypothetical protein
LHLLNRVSFTVRSGASGVSILLNEFALDFFMPISTGELTAVCANRHAANLQALIEQ